jgi:hypothetical protein
LRGDHPSREKLGGKSARVRRKFRAFTRRTATICHVISEGVAIERVASRTALRNTCTSPRRASVRITELLNIIVVTVVIIVSVTVIITTLREFHFRHRYNATVFIEVALRH